VILDLCNRWGVQSTPRSSGFNPSEEPRRPLKMRLGGPHRRSGRKKIIFPLPGYVPRTFQSAACKEATTHFYRRQNEVNGAWDSDSRHNAVGMETANIDSYVTVPLRPPGQGAATSPCAKQGQNCSLSGMTSTLCSAETEGA
jgi:hypothetical protein